MTTINRKEQWQASFDKAIASIEECLQSKPNDYPEKKNFRILANWLSDNPHSGYDYLPSGFENSISNPFDFDGLLSIIHHALCDDGGISFVTMKLEDKPLRVFMLLVDSNEDYFRTICEKENKSLMDGFIRSRTSMNEFKQKLKVDSPDKEAILTPIISAQSFEFETHRDPVRFIKEVEEFKIYREENNKKFDEKMAEFRKKKIF